MSATCPSVTDKVREFHHKFGVPVGNVPIAFVPGDVADFRTKFLQEELDEYKAAIESGDVVKQFDALIDLVYVAVGCAVWQGFDFDTGFNIVHAANMQKQRVDRAENSARGSGFDVIKPPGWVAPDEDLRRLLIRQTDRYLQAQEPLHLVED